MFGSFRAREHEALGPLLAIARAQSPTARKAWLDDIRAEAPTVVARVEQLLADLESAPPAAEADVRTRPAVTAPTAVPASRAPYWTAPPPRRVAASVGAREHREPAGAPQEQSPGYVAPSLAVGGLRR